MRKDNRVVMSGSMISDDLYILDIEVKVQPTTALISKKDRSIEDWHAVLGHPSADRHVTHPSKEVEARAKEAGDRVHADLVHSKNKNEEYFETGSGKPVRRLKTDNGSEFKNQLTNMLCLMQGVLQEFSTAYAPQSNGMIERAVQTITNVARTMLIASGLPETEKVCPTFVARGDVLEGMEVLACFPNVQESQLITFLSLAPGSNENLAFSRPVTFACFFILTIVFLLT